MSIFPGVLAARIRLQSDCLRINQFWSMLKPSDRPPAGQCFAARHLAAHGKGRREVAASAGLSGGAMIGQLGRPLTC